MLGVLSDIDDRQGGEQATGDPNGGVAIDSLTWQHGTVIAAGQLRSAYLGDLFPGNAATLAVSAAEPLIQGKERRCSTRIGWSNYNV
jgi:hypothetical protein